MNKEAEMHENENEEELKRVYIAFPASVLTRLKQDAKANRRTISGHAVYLVEQGMNTQVAQ